jgi:hypothetical protein
VLTVASRNLKNRLGRYLMLVRQGTRWIWPLAKPGQSDELAQLSRLIAAGSITLGADKLRRQWKPVRLKPGASIAHMIDEERQ